MKPGKALPWLLALYAATSLLHFAHNAEYLADYPNLPASWSRADVYVAWLCVSAVGLVGYIFYRLGREWAGIAILAVYAALGLDGLLHYTRAPLSSHSAAMNVTIWSEVIAAALVLIALAFLVLDRVVRKSSDIR